MRYNRHVALKNTGCTNAPEREHLHSLKKPVKTV